MVETKSKIRFNLNIVGDAVFMQVFLGDKTELASNFFLMQNPMTGQFSYFVLPLKGQTLSHSHYVTCVGISCVFFNSADEVDQVHVSNL